MILEISKFQSFIHLDALKEYFGDNMAFLYTNTHSFNSLIKNCDPYELKKKLIKKIILILLIFLLVLFFLYNHVKIKYVLEN